MTWQIQTLVENTALSGTRYMGEHGFSALLTGHGRRILFDTGQGHALIHNLAVADILPETIDTVIISHGHYDHTGGLAGLMKQNPALRVIAHPDAFLQKFWSTSSGARIPIRVPETIGDTLPGSDRFVPVTDVHSPAPGLTAFSGILLRHPEEPLSDRFFRMKDNRVEPDLFVDETAVLAETDAGWVLITGCAHRGILNTLSHARTLTDTTIHTVMGGFHLMGAGAQRVTAVCRALESAGICRIMPGHCTGLENMPLFHSFFRERLTWNMAGTTL